ncbi:hypothetical protein ACFW08_33835 [Streptomyces sp. NPDC058960]|uniref:hypothetical protein n=1 Tax=Streptomyces sp. NPDC058960 TaxID=3346679 RepID=UPI00367FD5EC
MTVSVDGQNARYHHKTVQSEELGIGFALSAAEAVLRRRLPNYSLSIIDADIALQAGWALAGKEVKQRDGVKLRPDYFIEARAAGKPPKVIVVECKGTHQKTPHVFTQLAKASSQVQSVQIGRWGTTPSLMIATELMAQSGITIHILDPEGDGTLHAGDNESPVTANYPAEELNIFPRIRIPNQDDMPETGMPGFEISPERFTWFRRVLARTAAASLMAFAGDRESAAELLTTRQGQRHFRGYVHPGTGIVQDATHEIRGITFTGTDLVFRLHGTRVEAFSGIAEPLYRMLAEGDVDRYRGEAPREYQSWNSRGGQEGWVGPVSMREDGSLMAMRILPQR